MPPSPAMRSSPGRQLKAENHKRGRSLESGMHFREKDDDLALFNEVQNKEKDNFLLQSNDDLDDVFSTRLRYFSDCKLGISIPARGQSSDLLHAEGDKNDYDWLLTPPDTPLFPSLDEEAPQVNLAVRGRPQSQPRSISRSSTMDKSYRSSRGSASPNRLSPSPRSAHSTYQSRGRPSSAPHSSPPPTLRPATPSRRPSPPPSKSSTLSLSPPPTLRHPTPSRRPSPPPNKPTTPVRRSSTPTPRRMSTGSPGAVGSSKTRGVSPVKTSRGNSASPNIKAWQSNIPGFSLEAPPNLRTSLADRPASYVRGSSPASRNGVKSGRQSMSPTASRSISSSHSHERDHFSSHSKGSIASSGDDDVDSIQSLPMSTSAARTSTFQNHKASGYSKKPNRNVSPILAPKRSFDMALRQMDQRKAPPNMFRPLLSSVPTSTFYSGKASAAHRSMVSRNSSITTSSNTSTDPGTSGAHDTEGSEQNLEEVTSTYMSAPISDMQDQVSMYDEGDSVDEDGGNKMQDVLAGSQYGKLEGQLTVDTKSCIQPDTSVAITSGSEVLVGEVGLPDAENLEDSVLCSKCGCRIPSTDMTDRDQKLCLNCRTMETILGTTTQLTTATVGTNLLDVSSKLLEYESLDPARPTTPFPEFLEASTSGLGQDHHDVFVKEDHHFQAEANWNVSSEASLAEPLMEEGEKLPDNHPEDVLFANLETTDGGIGSLQDHVVGNSFAKVEVPEGAGTSLPFRRSSSSVGHVVQGRSSASSDFPSDDFRFVRDTENSLRSLVGHGSISVSSSTDLSCARHMETCIQGQPSARKSEIENFGYDMRSKHQRSTSSLSGASSHNLQISSSTISSHKESSEVSAIHVEKNIAEEACVGAQENFEVPAVHIDKDTVEEAFAELQEQSAIEADKGDFPSVSESGSGCGTASEFSSNKKIIGLEYTSTAPVLNPKEFDSHGADENLAIDSSNDTDVEVPSALREMSTAVGDTMVAPCEENMDVVEVQNESTIDTKSKMEIGNGALGSSDPDFDTGSQHSSSSIDEMQEPSIPVVSNDDAGASVEISDISNHAHGTLEESTVMLEGQGGTKARSLTLEEATDSILFCSSIVHNLAYEAANIAIEKENSVALEGSRPTVTIVGKTNADRKDPHNKSVSRRIPKSRKARKQVQRDEKPPPSKTESADNMEVSTTKIVGAPNSKAEDMRPPQLESKCNCSIM